jgi:hypothetical protein
MIERVPIAGANIALFSSIAAIAISGLSARSAEAMANPNPLPQGLELFVYQAITLALRLVQEKF